jgi:hypothetical protein
MTLTLSKIVNKLRGTRKGLYYRLTKYTFVTFADEIVNKYKAAFTIIFSGKSFFCDRKKQQIFKKM